MVRLNKKRLENHPEKDRITITGNRCYVEIGTTYTEIGQGSILTTSVHKLTNGEKGFTTLTGSALVIAISDSSDMYKDGVRVGDTILISKDVELNETLQLDGQLVDNPYGAIYVYKTKEELKTYLSNPHNGPTAIIDSFKYLGYVRNNDTVPIEKYPKVENKIITPNVKITH